MEEAMHSEARIGMLAHDLRTPIAHLCGTAQLALECAQRGARVEEYLTQILQTARTLDCMTREMMDAAKPSVVLQASSDSAVLMNAANNPVNNPVFEGDALEAELCALIQPQAKARGQRLSVDLAPLRGKRFCGDYAALCRILTNLLTNAVKYTQRGGSVSLEAREAEEGWMHFAVRDNGMGMTREFMARMFQPFVRAKEAEECAGGMGIGLANVRRLVDGMRGRIDVRSREGKGTTFTVCVPLPEATAHEETLKDQRFLLAEDNPLAARILSSLLSSRGAAVRTACDGREAVRQFEWSEPGAFTALLVDLRMPELDGCGAARAIRGMRRPDARTVPIIAMTAGVDKRDAELAARAGMNACLLKPLDMSQLCMTLAKACSA